MSSIKLPFEVGDVITADVETDHGKPGIRFRIDRISPEDSGCPYWCSAVNYNKFKHHAPQEAKTIMIDYPSNWGIVAREVKLFRLVEWDEDENG